MAWKNLTMSCLVFVLFLGFAAAQPGAGLNRNIPSALTFTPAEIDQLLYLLDEEKLARDVYLVFQEQWDNPTFENIAFAEQRHLESVQAVLAAAGTVLVILPEGQFISSEFSSLFLQLVGSGSVSEEAALSTGAWIEELDLSDLSEASAATDNTSLQTLYGNLARGSRNHLRAFVRQLEVLGIDYAPQVLEISVFEEIVNSPAERRGGPGNRMNKARQPGTCPYGTKIGDGNGAGFGGGTGSGPGGGRGPAGSAGTCSQGASGYGPGDGSCLP